MCKIRHLSIIICFLSLAFVASCGESKPTTDYYVKVPQIRDKVISIDEMESVKSKYNIEIPFSVSSPDSIYYAVVIQVDIDVKPTSGNVTYDEVNVTMNMLETDGTTNYDGTGNIMILSAIPESVDRNSEVEIYKKIAGNFAAAVSEITAKIGAGDIKGNVEMEEGSKENYEKLYRTVTANHPNTTTVSWTFKPFKDESIVPGATYLVALIEVSDPSREYAAKVETKCSYSTPILFGLFRSRSRCIPDGQELFLKRAYPSVSGGQPSPGDSPEPGTAPEPGNLFASIIAIGITGSDDHVYTWYKEGTVSAGTSKDLDAYRPPETYTLPPGKSVGDIAGIGIAGSDDHVYVWYMDGTVSSGTSKDLDAYRPPENFSLPPGKSVGDIVDIGVTGSDDHVYVWYMDGTVSAGTSKDLDAYRTPENYSLPPGKSIGDIVGIAIAGSDDHVYTWFRDGTVSSGTSKDLDAYQSAEAYSTP